MQKLPLRLFFCTFLLGALAPQFSQAKQLSIAPVVQQAPEWCWAAAAQMVLKHYGFPNLNPGGNYQCGVVGAQGGPCAMNCALCLNAGGTTQRIAAVIQIYAVVAAQVAGFSNATFNPHVSGVLSPQEIIKSIDDDAPILAGISPTALSIPAGLGLSQHAVVIIGYHVNGDDLGVIVNDPFPYPQYLLPYTRIRGRVITPGQYELPYRAFRQLLNYGNSITFL